MFANRQRRLSLKTAFAIQMRQTMTDAERILWASLRGKQLAGLRFRRQQPVGRYVVDFYCPAARLIIELDGDQHGSAQAIQYDEARTQWLQAVGYRVLRFANGDVLRERDRVIDSITHCIEERGMFLKAATDPSPEFAAQIPTLPQGEGKARFLWPKQQHLLSVVLPQGAGK